MPDKYIFLDRDGTIIKDKYHTYKVNDFELLPKAVSGLKKLQKLGYKFIIISNQAGVAKGLYSKKEALNFHNYFLIELKKRNVHITKSYFCFHKESDNCQCRKPKNSLALKAAEDFNINLSEAVIIGDKDCDIGLGRNCSGKTFRIKNSQYNTSVKADFEVNDLEEVYTILVGT